MRDDVFFNQADPIERTKLAGAFPRMFFESTEIKVFVRFVLGGYLFVILRTEFVEEVIKLVGTLGAEWELQRLV